MANSIRTKIRDLKRLRAAVLLEGDKDRAHRINQEIQELVAAKGLQVHEPQIPNYENVDKLYAFYDATSYEKSFVLEGFTYVIAESKPNGIERIRKYKCIDEEDLFLYVHLTSDVVLKVYSRYEVGVES